MVATYTYNGNGQRVKKVVNGTKTIFHYSLNGQIIAESNSAGTITAEYVYLNGQPLAKMEGANTYYYHNDHLATPQKMTDASGTVVWAADYKPFGEVTITVSTITNNLRFPGQYYDAETGLHYNYYRDYNPALGRYVQADPIGLVGGINLFIYVDNGPIVWIDPWGLTGFPVGGPISISSPFGYRIHPITGQSQFHNGVDIPNPVGATVYATDPGTVISTRTSPSGGTQVIIQNNNGSISGYAHVDPSVQVGQQVNQGDPIGATNLTGLSTGGHVHYTYRPGANQPRVNPLLHLPQNSSNIRPNVCH